MPSCSSGAPKCFALQEFLEERAQLGVVVDDEDPHDSSILVLDSKDVDSDYTRA